MNQLEEQGQAALGSEDSWQARDILLAVVAFAVIAALGAGGYFLYQTSKAPPLKEGDTAPEFSFPAMEGGEVSLSDYRGKVVLVNIWATWCTPCREEMPSMERLYQSLKGQPFEIVAVSIDSRGATDVEPFAKQLKLSFPVLFDTGKKTEGLYQTTGVPESFIIDKNGVVAKRVIGPLDWSNSKTKEYQLIQHLLKSQ